MFCRKCGNKLKDNYNYCAKCGSKIYKNKRHLSTNVTNQVETSSVTKAIIYICSFFVPFFGLVYFLV